MSVHPPADFPFQTHPCIKFQHNTSVLKGDVGLTFACSHVLGIQAVAALAG